MSFGTTFATTVTAIKTEKVAKLLAAQNANNLGQAYDAGVVAGVAWAVELLLITNTPESRAAARFILSQATDARMWHVLAPLRERASS